MLLALPLPAGLCLIRRSPNGRFAVLFPTRRRDGFESPDEEGYRADVMQKAAMCVLEDGGMAGARRSAAHGQIARQEVRPPHPVAELRVRL